MPFQFLNEAEKAERRADRVRKWLIAQAELQAALDYPTSAYAAAGATEPQRPPDPCRCCGAADLATKGGVRVCAYCRTPR